MSIFDSLKKAAENVAGGFKKEQKTETFTFAALPESVDEMKALPEGALDTPFKTAALSICALCAYAAAPEIGTQMLDFLKGPQPLSPLNKQFLRDRFMDGSTYVPFSYFEGAVPGNDYTPAEPFKVTFFTNPYSFDNEGYVKLFVCSGGADSERYLVLRQKGEQWFLWVRRPALRHPQAEVAGSVGVSSLRSQLNSRALPAS